MKKLSADEPQPALEKVDSPCIRNCCLDNHDVCLGCFRHIDEIVSWSSASTQTRQTILERAKQRKCLARK